MLDIDGVEADHGCVEPDVGFGDVGTVVVGACCDGGEVLLDAVEGGEEGGAGGLVGGGCGCEAGFVDAVVDGVVGPVVCFFDFFLEVCGEEFDFLVFFVDYVVELCFVNCWLAKEGKGEGRYLSIHHADDFTALIADNLALLHIVQSRHRKSSLVFWIHREINIPQELMPQRICRHICARRVVLLWCSKPPALLLHMPVYGRKWYDIFETFERAYDEGSVCPWACVGDLEAIC